MVENGLTSVGLDADFSVRRSDVFQLVLELHLPAGKTVALLGPNGAGKSTAVAAITGLLAIDTGFVELEGTRLDDPQQGVFVPPEQRNVGVVFQDYLLFPHLTVLDNVTFGLTNRGVPKDEAKARSREWLVRLGLGELERSKPKNLSGGQAQRVALARALVTEPALLLLDEPLAALDVTTRTELRHVLSAHLEAFEGPRLLITHDPTEAFLLADEVHVLEDGVVTQSGTADDIRLRPRTAYAADLAGSNLVRGMAADGLVDTGAQTVHIADTRVRGSVLLNIHPAAVAVFGDRPHGSPRNTWQTTVDRVERLGSRIRLRTGPPLALTVELTDAARTEMSLDVGSSVWVAIKATEVGVQVEDPGQSTTGTTKPAP